MSIKQSAAWKQLEKHYSEDLKSLDIIDLFSASSKSIDSDSKKSGKINSETNKSNSSESRFKALTFEFDQLHLDFSKQKITTQTLSYLNNLAESVELKKAIYNLAHGKKINTTEDRAALHTALRLNSVDELNIDGVNINAEVQQQLSLMSDLIDKLTLGHWRGFSGKPIIDVVNLGVGGSDLGPLLMCHALEEFKSDYINSVNVHFASTMDGSQISSLFERLNPETTLFIIVSKSFSTIDTLSNAASAKAWLLNYCDNEAILNKQHFIGISTNNKKMSDWGIASEHQLKLWDWVGGRFSLWSAVGLSIAIKIGMNNFRLLLKGANALDEHFFNTPLKSNIPVLLGMVGIWNTNFLNINAQAILPYDARLKYFPDYLTQLEMESNGKSVTQAGKMVDYKTCPVLWGEVGPNAQHAFYQLLHQGTRKVACDFIAPIKRFSHSVKSADENNDGPNQQSHHCSLQQQHLLTLANCFAQSRALMLGGSTDAADDEKDNKLSVHKFYPGNQPSTTILLNQLTPYSLGQLIALYEHKVFVMATIWGINPFDQWGVELGKIMADETLEALYSIDTPPHFDDSTNGLVAKIRSAYRDEKQ